MGVLVDETTGVNRAHLGAVERGDFLPLAGVGVAAVLGKAEVISLIRGHYRIYLQDRKTVASEVLDLLIPAGGGERRWVTPRVVVESEEVTALICGSAVHVLGHFLAVGVDISSRVSDGDLTVTLALDVRSHVAGNSLDIWCSWSCRIVIDDLVSGEESEGVGVLCERINCREDVLEVDGVVGWAWVGSVKGVERRVDVEHEVDASSCQLVHAIVVGGGVVDGVHTDGVDAELLELNDVASAVCSVGDRVNEVGRSTGLVVHTAHVESAGSGKESWLMLVESRYPVCR